MSNINILVFPCGTEVGLEIHRSLKYSNHIKLFGGSSIDDHGKFVYKNYIGDIPFLNNSKFLENIKKVIIQNKIDAVYPAMDAVISFLKPLEKELNCKVISSTERTTKICSSKKLTYSLLEKYVNTPKIYTNLKEVNSYPVFIKPISGYGSRGAKIINSFNEGIAHLKEWNNCIITDYLPGEEYTIDCFSNKNRKLLFVGPRPRRRTRMGVSVNTVSIDKDKRLEFEIIANKINSKIDFRGAWFFQLKRDVNGVLSLMEIASRLGGSSLLYRYKGINFALLSVFDAFGLEVDILENKFQIEIDRAFSDIVKFDYEFNTVYVDFDDCLIIDGRINTLLLAKLYQYINEGKKIILITRHQFDIDKSLIEYRLGNLFDKVIHIANKDKKSKYIIEKNAIFIDDSHAERMDVAKVHNIPVFSPDMINIGS